MKVLSYLLDRLKEPTTYAGLFTVIAALAGTAIAPELADSIMAAGIGVASLILVLLKEKK
jgi:hypothetical protein